MITFYPRDLDIWKGYFDFSLDITVAPKEKNFFKVFNDREELIAFLKAFGALPTDPQYALKFANKFGDDCNGVLTLNFEGLTAVVAGDHLGWIKDDLR